MPYIGNTAADRFVASKAASVYSGDGSTTAFTLEHSVGADEDILVSVDGVIQEPSVAYAVSSGTTLTFTAAPSTNAGNNIFVYYLFRTVATVDHPATSALSATSGTFSTTLASTGNATVGGTLDVTGKVGILGANDLGLGLHIKEADSGASSVSTDADQLVIENSAESGITLLAGTSSASRIAFGDSGNSKIGMVYYNHGSNYMQFSTNDTAQMKIDSTGAVTKPNQPAFQARPTSQQSNLPINANTTIIFGTEIFDQNGDFASNTFTAPVTGKYQLSVSLYVLNADIDINYFSSILETSNRAYSNVITTSSYDADLSYTSITQSVLADMDANDTAYVYVNLPNQGAAQADIHTNSYFSGYLVA